MCPARQIVYRFESFELGPDDARLTKDGREVRLEPLVFDCLLLLVRRPGQLVSKRELLDALWPETSVNEEALGQTIHKLRRALGDSYEQPRFVETVRKRGFRFLPAVAEEFTNEERPPHDASPAAATNDAAFADRRAPASAREIGRRSFFRRGAWPLIAAVVVLTVTFVVMLAGRVSWRRAPAEKREAEAEAQPTPTADGRVRRITFFPERDEDAHFSPDGQSFVFVSKHEDGRLFKLYVGRTSGGTPVRLTRAEGVEEQTPRFSPDGQWVAYTRNTEGRSNHSVWKVSTLGSQESLVVERAGLPDWSPDSRELIYARTLPSGERAVMRGSLDGSSERELLRWPAHIDSLAWSPDGTQVVLWSNQTLWVFPSEGGEPRRLTDEGVEAQTPSWTPDGKAVLCGANWGEQQQVWMVPVDGGPPVPLTSGVSQNIYPSMSRDGRRILYTHESWQRQVWMVDAQGRNPQIVPTKTTFLSVSVDPQGRFLAYSDYELEGDAQVERDELGVMNLETREQRGLGRGEYPAFSPDGRRLAVLRERAAEGDELWTVELQTGATRRLTSSLSQRITPAWSPDGARIVFQRVSAGGENGLASVEVETGRETLLAAGSFRAPAWSPDGRFVAASGTGREGAGLYLVEVETGRARRLSELSSYEAAPVWSDDSRALRVLVDERTRPALVTLNLDGGEVSRMELEVPRDPSFWGVFEIHTLPGKGWIYLLQRVEGDIYMLDFNATTAGN
jgi:Tol biopolymer transport system component/DNA-binding winged helix-turn-helix (wHTH) protein